jgi:PAS domain S-box-containing protein
MVPHLPAGTCSDGGSEILWEDGERIVRRGWRRDDHGKRHAVLIVLPAADRPTRASLDRLAHEYELREELDAAWALRPLDLVHDAGRTALILEDVNGEPLDRLLGAPMEVGRFLDLAIAIAAAVTKLHQRSLVHKDIKPPNILVNSTTDAVRLTGFGIASRLARERQSPHPPETIAGTLAYMAPEQTGRMNRSIDSRSDLYALGVTFYQMLTGALPFSAADAMEWVHCHLARRPAPPADRVGAIPHIISAIVMKLLSKRAEDRYQTAAGLESDLRRCQTEWRTQRRVDDFPLGQRDTPDRLRIAERLYGRQREVEMLRTAFDRVVKGGAAELVLVSGYSGIGKSSVVNELQPVLVPPRGLFAGGKFDQYKRDVPYATLAQAFQGLVRPLLVKNDAELGGWREALREALGPNGQLMVGLVPELKAIIGEQSPVPELPPQDAQRRFQLVFRRFLAVFARPEHPLALFLDDLQWLDAATLDLLEHLLTHPDVRHVLLIGAYRDNEVTAGHPLMRTLAAIAASRRVQSIKLQPLTVEDLSGLVADSLHIDRDHAAPLAELVHEKTGGNPFFATQFLHMLAGEGLLVLDDRQGRWSFDVGGIHAKQYADNVVELLAGYLTRLPPDTQDALRQLACLGNVADIGMLSVVMGAPEEHVHSVLREALTQHLIERLDRSYKFVHDRVQEAAYALVPEQARAQAHLTIGRRLIAHAPPEKRDAMIFDIVNHLNRGAHLITSPQESEQLAELNLAAGQRAKASSAYASALTYLSAGAAVLPKDAWERRQALPFELDLHWADCEVNTGALPVAEERLAVLATRSVGTIQSCAVARRRVDLYAMLGESDQAVAVGLDALRLVGIDWPVHPTEADAQTEYQQVRAWFANNSMENIVGLPVMKDAEALATLDLLTVLTIPAMYTDLHLNALNIGRAVNLSLERGNSEAAPVNYAFMGVIAGARFGHHDEGYRLAKMACDLVDRRGLKHFGGRTHFFFAIVLPWTRPLMEGLDPIRRAFAMSKEHGQPTFAAHAGRALASLLLAIGPPLDQVEHELEEALEFIRPFGFFLDRISQPLALVRMLRGKNPKFGSLDDGRFTEQSFEQCITDLPAFAMLECYYWIRKLQARFFAGDYASALGAAESAERWYARAPALALNVAEMADFHFYAALSRAASCEPMGPRYTNYRAALQTHEGQLRNWAATCPENFENRVCLVGAEIARLEGRELDAERLYEAAIKSARANGFVHNEALAYELAARFYAARGFEMIANAYLREARSCYLRWGADGKVRQLEQLHPQLRRYERAPGPMGTIEAPVEQLDLATVIEVSQALSGEIVVEKLIDRFMRAAIEQAGAERALLIAVRGEELRTSAEATVHGHDVTVQVRQHPAHNTGALPESLIRYSMRTRDPVVLDDAMAQNPFSADPYIVTHHVRSVLSLPLINQGKLIGILHLENNLTPHVFTPGRVTVLKLLASQAAISLENTGLYRELADRELRIRRLVDANIIGIFVWELEGRILEANEAFLAMLGYDREDLIAGRLRWNELTPVEWRERDEEAVAEVRSTGTRRAYEKEYFRKDGSRVPVLIGGALFEGSSEGVAFVLDLTERKKAEEALRESERSLRSAIDGIAGLVAVAGPNGELQTVNRQVLEYFGRPTEELKNWGTINIIHPEDLPRVLEIFGKSIVAGTPFHYETRLKRFDGEFRWFDARFVPIHDDSGRIVRWYVLLTDIEDRTQAQARLQQMQSDFAHINRVSTMGELAASLSHEILHPIATARNNARAGIRFLEKSPPDLGEAMEAFGCVVRDVDRARDIVGRMRNHIQKAPPRKEHFEINQAVTEVIAMVRSEIAKGRIEVSTHLADGLVPVHGDRVQVQQVVVNLMLNAVEAMASAQADARQLWVSTRQAADNLVLVAVRDSGPGIDPDHLERVFEAFYTTKASGVGMGLSICRSIIAGHGGRLWAERNEDRGAVFQFTLPTTQQEDVAF